MHIRGDFPNLLSKVFAARRLVSLGCCVLIVPADVVAKPPEWFGFDDANRLRFKTDPRRRAPVR